VHRSFAYYFLKEASFIVGGRREYEVIVSHTSTTICLKRSSPNNVLTETREVKSGRLVAQSVSDFRDGWPQMSAKPTKTLLRLSVARKLEAAALLVVKATDLSPRSDDMPLKSSPCWILQIAWRIRMRLETRLVQCRIPVSARYCLARTHTLTGPLYQLRRKASWWQIIFSTSAITGTGPLARRVGA